MTSGADERVGGVIGVDPGVDSRDGVDALASLHHGDEARVGFEGPEDFERLGQRLDPAGALGHEDERRLAGRWRVRRRR